MRRPRSAPHRPPHPASNAWPTALLHGFPCVPVEPAQYALLKGGSRTQGVCCCLQAAEDVLQTIVQRQEQLGTAIQQLRAKQAEYLAKSEGHREIANQVLLRALAVSATASQLCDHAMREMLLGSRHQSLSASGQQGGNSRFSAHGPLAVICRGGSST